MDQDPDHQPKLSPVKAFRVMQVPSAEGCEELYTSLSEYHDYEPNLEFDDSELTLSSTQALAPLPPELVDIEAEEYLSVGTLEYNFEEQLADAPQVYTEIINSQDEDTFAELRNFRMVDVVGDDEVGRRIVVIYACRFPNNQDFHPDKLLKFLMYTLDSYVEQDYSVVYFHYGLTNTNKPPLSWLWKAYKAFDRKYKKNLKALYLVHPTNIIRVVWQMLKPVISVKFGRKMMYVNYLHELKEHVDLSQIHVPQSVFEHNELLLAKNPKAMEACKGLSPEEAAVAHIKALRNTPPLPTHQFGVSLQFIQENNESMVDSIPPIVRQCVDFLSQPAALETEGLFRRSANVALIKELIVACNRGERVSFRGDPHNAAVLLKTFLRDLEEPLMTFDLYDEITKIQTCSVQERPRKVKILILEKLPIDNYKLLKYIVQFLWKVMDRCDLNKMTSSNLAVVFGPNLVRPQHGQMTLQAIAPINQFTDFILQNQGTIFII